MRRVVAHYECPLCIAGSTYFGNFKTPRGALARTLLLLKRQVKSLANLVGNTDVGNDFVLTHGEIGSHRF